MSTINSQKVLRVITALTKNLLLSFICSTTLRSLLKILHLK